MNRIKTFWHYFLIFLAFYIIIDLLTYGFMATNKRDIKQYEIKTNDILVDLIESKATYGNGYLKAKITNTTKEIIDSKYLCVDFFNKDGAYLGSKFKELKNFNEGETMNIFIEYNYTRSK